MYIKVTEDRIRQGDIFRDLEFRFVNDDGSTGSIAFPFWVVLTQDCDLEQDYSAKKNLADPAYTGKKNQDKLIQTVLACPAFVADQLKEGTHMSDVSWTMERWSSDLWKPIKGNNNARFHMLPQNTEFSLPDLVIDFKRFFTLPREYCYSNASSRAASVDDLFKEAISQRFAYYLSRVALPEPEVPAKLVV